jgi:hypothetical protein
MSLANEGLDVPPRAGRPGNHPDRSPKQEDAMVVLAGAAQHVLGQLGSLQQTAAGVQSSPVAGASGLFNLNSSSQGAGTASSSASGTGGWWSSPTTMNALLSAQDSGSTGSAGNSSGSTTAAQGHHGGHHHHAGSTQDTDQNTSATGTTTDASSGSSATSTSANGGTASLFSQLFNTQLFSAVPAGQSLSTLV